MALDGEPSNGEIDPSPFAMTSQPSLKMAELIGSGKHGTVVRAVRTDASGSTNVVVKLPPGGGTLADEATALVRFAHRNVVALIDGPLSDGQLVLEYCCLLYTSPSPRDKRQSRMPSSA